MSWLDRLGNRLGTAQNFVPRRWTLDHYIQTLALMARRRPDGHVWKEPCFFNAMGLHPCNNRVKMAPKRRLVSFKIGKFRLAFDELPICPDCRLLCKDSYRAKLNRWSEEEMWQELVPIWWFTEKRQPGGSLELFVSDKVFAMALGTGFALRTMLKDPVATTPSMTVPPNSYHVRRDRVLKKGSYGAESALDSIMRRAEEAQ